MQKTYTDLLLPSKFTVSWGGFKIPSINIEWYKDHLNYEKTKWTEEIKESIKISPNLNKWSEFWDSLEKINFQQWEKEYEELIFDGVGWYVEILYKNKTLSHKGRGAGYSKDFKKFFKVLKKLIDKV